LALLYCSINIIKKTRTERKGKIEKRYYKTQNN